MELIEERLPIPCDLSSSSLEQALSILYNPSRFTLSVHPYAKHYAIHVAFPDHHLRGTMEHLFKVELREDFHEHEWMVSSTMFCVRSGLK